MIRDWCFALGLAAALLTAAPASAQLALGSSVSVTWKSAAGGSVILPTISAGDVIIVAHYNQQNVTTIRTVAAVTASGLTFARLGGISRIVGGAASQDMEIWRAAATAPATNTVIQVDLDGSACHGHVHAYAIQGAYNPSSPFDNNPSMPATAAGDAPPPPSVTISTSQANDFMAWASGGSGTNSNSTPPATWTGIKNTTQSGLGGCLLTSRFGTGYKIFSATVTGQSYESSTNTSGMVVLGAVTGDPLSVGGGIIPRSPLTHW